EGPARLPDDHRRARRLAECLAAMPGVSVDLGSVHTNIEYSEEHAGADRFAARCAENGAPHDAMGRPRCSLVTHFQVDDDDVTWAREALGRVAAELAATATA